jgi:hypothetical protein
MRMCSGSCLKKDGKKKEDYKIFYINDNDVVGVGCF